MAFTYDPTTARGRVRLVVGDTDDVVAANQIFTDAEIDAFLSLENNEVFSAAAAACESLAAATSRSAIVVKAGRALDINLEAVPRHYRLLSKELRKRAQSPSEEIDSFDFKTSRFGEDLSEYVGDVV